MSMFARSSSKRIQSCLLSQCRSYSAPVDTIPAAKQRFIPEPEASHFPKGFLLGSAHAGVKASNKTKDDVCIIASEKLCNAAGFYTVNTFRAAPVSLSKQILADSNGEGIRGVVINSGCANAVTGTDGVKHANDMVSEVDSLFAQETSEEVSQSDSNKHRTLVMSTGVIGQKLPISKILSVLPTAKSNTGSGYTSWLSTAKAIMTTDTFPKLVTTQFTLPSTPTTTYTIAGITKGAGMIHPNLGTLLSVICTDAPVPAPTLQTAGRASLSSSFNAISIDGDTSTNDSVVLLANGAASPSPSTPISSPDDIAAFTTALRTLMSRLAQLVVRDGEGATKFITIRVRGAENHKAAAKVAETIARSPLVKTAMYGRDANWGRILCAIGNSGVEIEAGEVTVEFGMGQGEEGERMMLVKRGQPVEVDEEVAKQVLEREEVDVWVDLEDRERGGKKEGEATFWTCDFSHEYVTINGDYRT